MAQVPPRNPKYSVADLWPPGSKENVDFPPAAFFPVYLGNFLCQQQPEMVARVQQYFASKGLLARMVFVRSPENDPFRNYQDKTKLYDCLVYFTRQEDADDAVKYLHRDKYYGHRLNIFPGRVPDFVVVTQSVGYDIPSRMIHWPDDIIAKHIRVETFGNVRSVKRQNADQVIVQFGNTGQREKALRRYRYFMPHSLVGQVFYNQRFLEFQVMDEIRAQIANTPFMFMGPERYVLDALFAGRELNAPKNWMQDAPTLYYYTKNLIAHHPRVQLQIAQATHQHFGLVCDFVAELSHTTDRELQKELKMFFQGAVNNGTKNRHGFREVLIKSYGYRKGRRLYEKSNRK